MVREWRNLKQTNIVDKVVAAEKKKFFVYRR